MSKEPKEPILSDTEIVRFSQGVVAALLIIVGIYMIGPWYVVLPGSAAFGLLAEMSVIYIKLISAAQIAIGCGILYGAIWGENEYTRTALVGGFSMYALIVMTRLVTVGFIPLIWAYQFAIMLIVGAIALGYRRR